MADYEPGDRVRILVGGPHENFLQIATVSHVQQNGDIILYLGDQDEDEFVYSSAEVEKA